MNAAATTAPMPQPVFFGPVGATLFGWLHRPAGPGKADFGLVICNPFGFEQVCAHRSLRQLACAAAAAGIAVLRFDYAGCGNSCGDESEPRTLKRWIDSVHEAIDTLEHATGLPRVCLLGLRLGATLAALAAEQRSDIAGLVAIAPVVSCRAWLRELRLLGGAPHAADGSLESAGFTLSGETCAALDGVNLRRLERAPAQRVLIVERDDLPIGDAWPTALIRLDADVRCERWRGYAAMVADPQRAQVPHAIVDGVVRCLSHWRQAPPPQAREAPIGASSTLCGVGGARVRESAMWLEAGGARLFGVLTTPQAGPAQARAVVMLNAGSVHHIGPNRLWVRLARQWAARGLVVLRLDIGGIGDSPVARGGADNVVYPTHAARDIAAAVAFLQREFGARELSLVGLCSGAYHALKAAVAGQVASAVVINPLTFFWKEGMKLNVDWQDADTLRTTARYRRSFWRGDTWRRLLQCRLDLKTIARAVARRVSDTVRHRGRDLARTLHITTRDDLAAELNAAVQHGTRIAFVFANGDPGQKLLELHGGRAVKQLIDQRRISVDLIDGADHTFTRAEARERLIAVLERLLFMPASQPAKGPAPAADPLLRSASGVRGAQL